MYLSHDNRIKLPLYVFHSFIHIYTYHTLPYITLQYITLHYSTDRQTYRHTHRQADRHTDIQTQTQRHTDIQTCRHIDIQTYRHTDIQTYSHTGIQASRHPDIQTYRHTDKQTNRHTYIYIYAYIHSWINGDHQAYPPFVGGSYYILWSLNVANWNITIFKNGNSSWTMKITLKSDKSSCDIMCIIYKWAMFSHFRPFSNSQAVKIWHSHRAAGSGGGAEATSFRHGSLGERLQGEDGGRLSLKNGGYVGKTMPHLPSSHHNFKILF